MKYLENVIYDNKPDNVSVYPSCVDVVQTCEEIEIEDEISGGTYHKFKCSINRYTVAEYINVLQKQNEDLSQQMTQVQSGIVEAYEMLLDMV